MNAVPVQTVAGVHLPYVERVGRRLVEPPVSDSPRWYQIYKRTRHKRAAAYTRGDYAKQKKVKEIIPLLFSREIDRLFRSFIYLNNRFFEVSITPRATLAHPHELPARTQSERSKNTAPTDRPHVRKTASGYATGRNCI